MSGRKALMRETEEVLTPAEEAKEDGGAQFGAVVFQKFLEDVVPGIEEGQIEKRVQDETA